VNLSKELDLDRNGEVQTLKLGPDVECADVRQWDVNGSDMDTIFEAALDLGSLDLESLTERGLEVQK